MTTTLVLWLFAFGGPFVVLCMADALAERRLFRLRWRYNLLLAFIVAVMVQFLIWWLK